MKFYLLAEETLLLNSNFKQLDYMLYWEIENCGLYFKKEVNQKK